MKFNSCHRENNFPPFPPPLPPDNPIVLMKNLLNEQYNKRTCECFIIFSKGKFTKRKIHPYGIKPFSVVFLRLPYPHSLHSDKTKKFLSIGHVFLSPPPVRPPDKNLNALF